MERAGAANIRFLHGNAFTLPELTGPYDLIYDSGCFHHLPPHRRVSYLDLLDRTLAQAATSGWRASPPARWARNNPPLTCT
jgi:hypothetical protein